MTTSRTVACGALLLSAVRAAAQGRVEGIVYDSLYAHAPLANATVVLIEQSRYATTDARGRFRIDSVPPGRYTLGLTHPLLDSLGLELSVVPVDVTGRGRVVVSLATPSMPTIYARLCPGPHEPGAGGIIGRVRDVDDQSSLADATVSTGWTEFALAGGRTTRQRARDAEQSNPKGVYVLCGVPTGVPLEVTAELAGFVAGPTPLELDQPVIRRVDFALSRRDSAARGEVLGDSTRIPTGTLGTAVLRGRVVGSDGRPLDNAAVDVLGSARVARTDARGAFQLQHIAAGTRTIQVTSIGLVPTHAGLDFRTNETRDTTFVLGQQVHALEADTVRGAARSMSLMENDGFDTRRRIGFGAFVTEQEISRHNYPDLASVLRGVRGVRIECNGGGAMPCVPMPTLLGVSDRTRVFCTPNYFLDGAPYPVANTDGFAQLSAFARPGIIRGIEVYSNPVGIPPPYDLSSSTGCGSIVIWTR